MPSFSFILFIIPFLVFKLGANETDNSQEFTQQISNIFRQSRRILNGHEVGETRPYLVYLRRAGNTTKHDKNWLCGGVIIDKRYILTSAACISDAVHFYIISGTSKWVPHDQTNECIENGAKRAIWKCFPRSYVYDGSEINNFRWMGGDIAVVKTDEDFNFKRRIKGCEFIPNMIRFNNDTEDWEKSGTIGTIAGWGSTDKFGDTVLRNTANNPVLLEADVKITTQTSCKNAWHPQYHYIIEQGIICGKDNMDLGAVNAFCNEEKGNCESLLDSHELMDKYTRRVDNASANDDARRSKEVYGGFCENDHGGPLIVGRGVNAMVIGTITASQVSNTKRCRGPYLFTSVFYHRDLIACAVSKDTGQESCLRAMDNGNMKLEEKHFDWSSVPLRYGMSKKSDKLVEVSKDMVTTKGSTAKSTTVTKKGNKKPTQKPTVKPKTTRTPNKKKKPKK